MKGIHFAVIMRIYYFFSKRIDLLPKFLLVRLWGIPRPTSDLYVERGDLAEIVVILVSITKTSTKSHSPNTDYINVFLQTFSTLEVKRESIISITHTHTLIIYMCSYLFFVMN